MNSTVVAQSMNHGMSTVMIHKAFGQHAEESLRAVRDEAVRLEELLTRAIEFSRYCQGLFDVIIGPLVTLWNNGKDTFKPPEDSRVRQVLPLVDYTGFYFGGTP